MSWIPKAIFEPVTIAGLRLSNRLAMAPMTREFAPQGVLVPEAVDYYRRRAAGGVGLIVTEGAAVPHAVAHHNDRVPHLYGGPALARWREVFAAVHAAGGHIFPQLLHCGLGRHRAETANPDMPSIGPSIVGREEMRAMTEKDIADVIEAFATAAANMKAAGADGVAVHGAHGYLIDAFCWARTNRRADRYNGGINARMRFAAEIVGAIRRRVGRSFPIMYRFSQWKGSRYDALLARTPAELEAVLSPLVAAGVDILDASTRRFWVPEFVGSDLNLAGWAKVLTGLPCMTVGSVGLEGPLDGNRVSEMSRTAVSTENLRVLDAMVASGAVDLVAVGRILLANADWPNLVRAGHFERIRPYDPGRTAETLEPSYA